MDRETVNAYDTASATYASDWLGQPAPTDMYALLATYFEPGRTIDVGCGAGRDVAWLKANGFDAKGVDASSGLLSEARKAYPGIDFQPATLPALLELEGERFQNVLCETVLMHLDPADVKLATQALLALLLPGGTLYLSWRVTRERSLRDSNGRLYASFASDEVRNVLLGAAQIVFDKEQVSASSGKIIHRLIAKKFGV
jgi:SAM-dependent methyltransferase